MPFDVIKKPHGQHGSECIQVTNTGQTFLAVTANPQDGYSALISTEPNGLANVYPPKGGQPIPHAIRIGPGTALYVYPGNWPDGLPRPDITKIDGEIVKVDPVNYRATFTRSDADQPQNPTNVIVDIYVSEGGGRGHGE
jgi:hypothetical protein